MNDIMVSEPLCGCVLQTITATDSPVFVGQERILEPLMRSSVDLGLIRDLFVMSYIYSFIVVKLLLPLKNLKIFGIL